MFHVLCMLYIALELRVCALVWILYTIVFIAAMLR